MGGPARGARTPPRSPRPEPLARDDPARSTSDRIGCDGPHHVSKPISSDTEQRLREAMNRLFNGTSQATDGVLTLANLGREAGISPATVHRAVDIKAEFVAEVGRRRGDEALAQLARRQERVGGLK